MAKVRIQARSTGLEDEAAEKQPHPHKHNHKAVGALDVLANVWRREGFFGLYQVCI